MFVDIKQRILQGDKQADVLFKLIAWFRPANRFNLDAIPEKMNFFLAELDRDEEFNLAFKRYIQQLFAKRRFKVSLTETGIIGEGSFYKELMKRIWYKILPFQPPEDTLDYLLTNGLFTSWDHQWIKKITPEQWQRLFKQLNMSLFPNWTDRSFAFSHLLFCIQVLSQQASATGTGSELFRMIPEYQNLESPFLSLQKEIDHALAYILSKNGRFVTEDADQLAQVFIFIEQCRELLQKARKNKSKYGISFSITMRILRLEQQLDRLYFLIDFLESKILNKHEEMEIDFARRLIDYHAGKNRIVAYLNQTTHLVAYQATQHTGTSGEKYITATKKEYHKMFWSAAGGGFIIGFLALFKMLYSGLDTSLFGQAFLYSMNYALGFILIYFLHYTVATKQPAMTAAALARSLENQGKSGASYDAFSALFARLFRSQFIAFCGNVFFAFPVALMVAWIANIWLDGTLIPSEKTEKLLRELDPRVSSPLFHAGIAGFHLFFSGLLSGYLVNRSIHLNVAYRIQKHPLLVQVLAEKKRINIAAWYEKHLGGLTSNLALGMLLGCTGTIGFILGVDWDIRHITFSAANFALAIVGRDFSVSLSEVIVCVLCVGGIGFFNFIVSFGLSLLVAMRSRRISFIQLLQISKAIFTRFLYVPMDFFIPPSDGAESKL